MHLNIKSDQAYQMAKELSRLTGENLTQAVTRAIALRLEKERKQRLESRKGLGLQLLALAREYQNLTKLDNRQPDDILYDEFGLPKKQPS